MRLQRLFMLQRTGAIGLTQSNLDNQYFVNLAIARPNLDRISNALSDERSQP